MLSLSERKSRSQRQTNNGKQRYLCNDCGKMSRDNPQPNGYLPEEREQILAAYQERFRSAGLNSHLWSCQKHCFGVA